ncbi:hypothetical protein [Candidatus Hodarchaeum mangrovi]
MKITHLLLADPSVNLRIRVLTELLNRDQNDNEVKELIPYRLVDPLVNDLLSSQLPNGSWPNLFRLNIVYTEPLYITTAILIKLGYIGVPKDHPIIKKAIEFVFSNQLDDGSWPLPQEKLERKDRYTMIPLQTAFPLRGVVMNDYTHDKRAKKAFEWLLSKQLSDGAFPAGEAGGNPAFIAGYRKLPHSKHGCRTNTTMALLCFGVHKKYREEPLIMKALDLLLGRETRERNLVGYEVARYIGLEPIAGHFTYFQKFDVALILHLCSLFKTNLQDSRVQDLVTFIESTRNPYGLWEYSNPLASRWVTFDILNSLKNIHEETEWISYEPQTPYRSYPRRIKRF